MSAFEGFVEQRVSVKRASANTDGAIEIFARVGGSGPPLLLLHGFPQTHRMWRHVAPTLAKRYTVICADLRGYGRSSKPRGSDSHVEYSKREMANDMIGLMTTLGHSKFSILAHDRGARVAHRLALDHPEKVEKMVLLDIAPTLWMYDHTSMTFATGYWHWFFLIQGSPQTEDMIMADPQRFWALLGSRSTHTGVKWTQDDMEEYQRYYLTSEGVHATCEDYRASATIDLDHDRDDLEASRKLKIPSLKVIWGSKGMIDTFGDVREIWRGYCHDLVELAAESLDCGHYIAEEKPDELLQILRSW